MTIDQIKQANEAAGYFFFEAGALRFFRSRISPTVYEGPGGIYFITSEQFVPSQGPPAPRRFTVRQFNPSTGDIATAGEFNVLSRSVAVRKAKELAEGK